MTNRHSHQLQKQWMSRPGLRLDFLRLALLCLTSCACISGPLRSEAYGQENVIDLCRELPGETVAKAVDGNLLETKSMPGRCLYIVDFKNSGAPSRAFVVYWHKAEDYDALKAAMDGELKQIQGLGEEAVISFDMESGRYWLLAFRRDRATYQISGDNEELVRKVAEAALQ